MHASKKSLQELGDNPFRFRDKLLLLRLFRMGRLPSGLYAGSLLWSDGAPVLALEFGQTFEPHSQVFEHFPRRRWAAAWSRFLPARVRAISIWWVTLIRLFCAFLIEGRPRLIVAHGLQEQCLARALRLLLRVPYVVQVHEAFEFKDLSLTNKCFLLWEGPCLRQAEFLIFPEARRLQIYSERYHLRNKRYLVFNCPPRALPASASLPETLRKTPGRLRLLYVGGIGPNNGLEHAVSALKVLSNVELCLVGWCEAVDKEWLLKQARELGVDSRVRFMGTVTEEVKWALLRDSDIAYCLYEPSTIRLRHVATASNKFMESIAAGLPVLTNHTESFQDVLSQYEVGLAVKEITPSGVLEGLRTLVTDDALRERMSKTARTLHETQFNYEVQFREVRAEMHKRFRRAPVAAAGAAESVV